jgi:8-oxo-dGTP diphosphatase
VRTAEGVFLPGGGIEAGETPALAVKREAFEECGLVVRAGAWAIRTVQFAYSAREKTHFEKRSTFLDAVVEGAAPAGTEPDHEVVWVSPETAPQLLSHESHGIARRRSAAGKYTFGDIFRHLPPLYGVTEEEVAALSRPEPQH